MQSKFLLICGVTGAGKSTIMDNLKALDGRFVRIKPYTTRKTRKSGEDKISVSEKKINRMKSEGKFIFVNKIYASTVGTPKAPIIKALKQNKFPVLDFPIDKVHFLKSRLKGKVFCVYVEPDGLKSLMRRLKKGKKENIEDRIASSRSELERVGAGEFDDVINFRIVNVDRKAKSVSRAIYKEYISGVEGQ